MKHVSLVWIGILFGLLIPAILRWVGLPTGDNLFEKVLGDSTWWKGVILFSIVAIALFFLFKNAIKRDKEKT